MNRMFRNILNCIVIIIVQIVVLNNVNILGHLCPYLYLLCVMMLPINLHGSLIMLYSFMLGLVIDLFCGTLGLHAASTVAMGAVFKLTTHAFHGRNDTKPGTVTDINTVGTNTYILFTLCLVSVHHVLLFFLDTFSFNHFFTTLKYALLNMVLTSSVIIFCQLIFRHKKK